MTSDLHDIQQVLQTCFDGRYEGNIAKLGQAFHEAHLFSVEDRKLADMSRKHLFELVRSRQSR